MLKLMEMKLHRPLSPISPQLSLSRQHSTSSLPGKKSPIRERQHKMRLSYSLKRIKRRKTSRVEQASLPEEYQHLRKVNTDFEQFLNVVLEDLKVKLENLKQFKTSETTTLHDRSYATLQMFMLHKYSNRIQSFKTVSIHSIENICQAHREAESPQAVTQLVEKYSKVLGKMKRRMKHMIDVSEKYAVVEIFDTINILNEVSKDLDSTVNCDQRRSVISLGDLHYPSLDSPLSSLDNPTRKFSDSSMSSGSSSGQQSDEKVKGNTKTLRSLSDHLCVLRKTFLN
eukprot:GFUD01031018.1.p1 GENE.GFUD01031018.1~~GFUD01031018.1.p1  ORF type:complete len:284 (-),score=87.93 GFUD01031018.1:111-962(-)